MIHFQVVLTTVPRPVADTDHMVVIIMQTYPDLLPTTVITIIGYDR